VPPEPVRYGDVWLAKIPGQDESVPYLVLSSDTYLAAPMPRVVVCQVVRRPPRRGEIAEAIPDYGTALLDRVEWLWREWLQDRPATRPSVPVFRHSEVHRVFCNLIGP
jgi:hypothetical protein